MRQTILVRNLTRSVFFCKEQNFDPFVIFGGDGSEILTSSPLEFLVQKVLGGGTELFFGIFFEKNFLSNYAVLYVVIFLLKIRCENKVIFSFKLRLEIYGNISIKLHSSGDSCVI